MPHPTGQRRRRPAQMEGGTTREGMTEFHGFRHEGREAASPPCLEATMKGIHGMQGMGETGCGATFAQVVSPGSREGDIEPESRMGRRSQPSRGWGRAVSVSFPPCAVNSAELVTSRAEGGPRAKSPGWLCVPGRSLTSPVVGSVVSAFLHLPKAPRPLVAGVCLPLDCGSVGAGPSPVSGTPVSCASEGPACGRDLVGPGGTWRVTPFSEAPLPAGLRGLGFLPGLGERSCSNCPQIK